MTCRRCRGEQQQPYEIADVLSFLIAPSADPGASCGDDEASPSDPEAADDSAEAGEDRPLGSARDAQPDYRFAWSG